MSKLEVHSHRFISGPRSRSAGAGVTHSHEGGNESHEHPDAGPAFYTIDQDDWKRLTGLVGGRRKKFTAAPVGEQLPLVERSADECSFAVVIHPSAARFAAENGVVGPGLGPVARIALGFKMHPVVSPAPTSRKWRTK